MSKADVEVTRKLRADERRRIKAERAAERRRLIVERKAAARQGKGKNKDHERVQQSFLTAIEKRVLRWLAARLPGWVNPDILTGIGVFGSVVIFAGYALTNVDKNYLWLASLGFALNWFGDSLDGTLARFRHIERPKYGFFIDHTTDAFSQVFVFFGLGVSPYIRFDVATVALVGYLLLSVLVYVRTFVTGVFKLSYIGLGPTELRLIIILANAVVFFVGNPQRSLALGVFSVYDGLIILLTILIFGVFIFSALRQARIIERMEKDGLL